MKIIQQWNQEDSEYIRRKLVEYNMEQLSDHPKTPSEKISFILKDDNGEIFGGIVGSLFWGCMHIAFLWINKSLRNKGYGSILLKKAEDFAKENNCRLIHLDTFSFQAPDFYMKNGYEIFGVIEDHPKGYNQYFLQKRLDK